MLNMLVGYPENDFLQIKNFIKDLETILFSTFNKYKTITFLQLM